MQSLAYWFGCSDTEKLFDIALVRTSRPQTCTAHRAFGRPCGFVQMNELLEQSGEDVRLPLDVPALSCTQVILAYT